MNRHINLDGQASRGGYTWKEVLTVVIVIGLLLSLVLSHLGGGAHFGMADGVEVSPDE
ncbi:MAG: hypothetical protein KKA28_04865 [Planctomycetes bacterium]|nr:hypothetical protein [Planctomycetota bacterium]MCG2682867.1 hypothetical protein [Planctomycetales bacterium]